MITSAEKNWKRTAARNVSRLSLADAEAVMERIGREGITVFHPDVRDITGGFNSQSINFHVMRLLWAHIKRSAE